MGSLTATVFLFAGENSVTNNDANLRESSVKRHVPLDGQTNFRDIGGYKTKNGKTVKTGLVFRSGHLGSLTDKDVQTLETLEIKSVCNFLTKPESKDRGKDRIPTNAHEISIPIETNDGLAEAANIARQTGDFSRLPASMNPEIHRLLVEEAKQEYAQLMKQIIATEKPLVYHCSHGVHRTGTATALLLWTLGVPWETIRKDYLLSNKYRAEETKLRLAKLKETIAKNKNVSPDQVDMTNVNAFYILQGRYIDATRDEILKKYGSIDSYLIRGLKLNPEEIQALRDRMLE